MNLLIDTSTKLFNLALSTLDGKLVKKISILTDNINTHSKLLFQEFDNLLKSISVSLNEITKIGVTLGPGSFTGIRIGLSFAKTLSQMLNLPVVGISTLDVIAYSYFLKYNTKKTICAIVESTKNEVFTAYYKPSGKKLKRISRYFISEISKLKNTCKITNTISLSALAILTAEKKGRPFYRIVPLYIKPPKIHK